MDFQQLKSEMREMRLQMKADFAFQTAGLGDVSRRLADLGRSVAQSMTEMSERMGEMEGRMRSQESRFSRMLMAVEDVLDSATPRDEFLHLVHRVEILEAKDSLA